MPSEQSSSREEPPTLRSGGLSYFVFSGLFPISSKLRLLTTAFAAGIERHSVLLRRWIMCTGNRSVAQIEKGR